MEKVYTVRCNCGEIELSVRGEPRAKNYCHCNSCRDLLNVTFFEGTAWDQENVDISKGEEKLILFEYPGKKMCRYTCRLCSATVFHMDRFEFLCTSYSLFRKANSGKLDKRLEPTRHYYYGERLVDISDDLPKYLKAVGGPLVI